MLGTAHQRVVSHGEWKIEDELSNDGLVDSNDAESQGDQMLAGVR
jgi:hypothetical protein